MSSQAPTAPTSYDEVPYDSHPFPQTHPDRLATVATLFGLRPAAVARSRVLELGCASGGNLIPFAEQYPESKSIGIDLSSRQAAMGRALVERLGLTNIDIRHASILDVDESYGTFDFIICHGVFSWVPTAVQEKIFEILAQRLNPNGVGYISYNLYPGWRMREMVRDMMRFHARKFATNQRVRQARALLDFLAGTVKQGGSAYEILLRQEVESLRRAADSYFYHEHLEDVNDPIYFHEFVERAGTRGLQYLGETRVGTMVMSNLEGGVEATLKFLASDQIEAEQYLDFLRNRMFRETLLCRKGLPVNWAVQPDVVRRLHVASAAVPAAEPVDLKATEATAYRSPSGHSLGTADPVLRAAMGCLRDSWPQALPFSRLKDLVRDKLTAVGAAIPDVPAVLASGLLNAYLRSDLVELRSGPLPLVTEVSEAPLVSPLARVLAEKTALVTNRRHEVVNLNPLERQIIQLLDGQRRPPELLKELNAAVDSGHLIIQRNDEPIESRDEIRSFLEMNLAPSLARISRMALLVA